MGNVYSSESTALQTAGTLVDIRGMGGKMRVFPFTFTFASAGAAPTLYLTKIPGGHRIWDLYMQTDGLSASAGVGLTINIGDSGDADRYYQTWDADVANAVRSLRFATGWGYEITVDTWIVGAVAAGKTPADGQSMYGYFIATQE